MRCEGGATFRGRGYRARVAALCASLLAGALPARALVLRGEPDEEARASVRAAGVEHVGRIGGTTGIYLGDGWVLTAGHAGAGELGLGEVRYAPVEGSWIRLRGGSGERAPDLGLFRVEPRPPLPRIEIASRPPRNGEALVLVGCGLGRGDAFQWDGRAGWTWAPPPACRWGRNRIASVELDLPASNGSTRTFATYFSDGEPLEAQAALGDSGGAGFVHRHGRWELAGVMIAVKGLPEQPPNSAVVGNATHLADLSHYRAEILARIGQGTGAALR